MSRRRGGVIAALMLLASLFTAPATAATTATPLSCVYSAHSIAELGDYSALVRRPVTCATVFNDTAATWDQWSSPWFLHQSNPDLDWAGWARADRRRHLVVTQSLFPASVQSQDWLRDGARGDYVGYAKTLARNLVAAGLGASSIRLANEANGTWYPYSVPADAAGQKRWVKLWDLTVKAMRSVPGATFSFVWSVNYQVRPLPLASFYPGDQFVDVVGLDAYDASSTATSGRYGVMARRAGGIDEVLAFAAAHHRPLALPEWGLMPTGSPQYGGGDDPDYVDGIAALVSTHDIAFAGYWYARADTMSLLRDSPASLAALRHMLTSTR